MRLLIDYIRKDNLEFIQTAIEESWVLKLQKISQVSHAGQRDDVLGAS